MRRFSKDFSCPSSVRSQHSIFVLLVSPKPFWPGPIGLFMFLVRVEFCPGFPTFSGPGLTGFGPWTAARSLTNFGDSSKKVET